MTFGEYFFGLRKEKRKTQKQIAEIIGKTTMYVSGVESGKNGSFREDDLEKIAQALELSDCEKTELLRSAVLSRNKLPGDVADYFLKRDKAFNILKTMSKINFEDDDLERIQEYILKLGDVLC